MRRVSPLIVIVMIAGMILMFLGRKPAEKELFAAGALLTAAGFAVVMVQGLRAGVYHTNYGLLRRKEHPVGFWAATIFWSTVLLLWTFGGVLHGLGKLVR